MMRSSLAFILFALLLVAGGIAHLGIGARFIAPQTVLQAFFHFDPRNFDHNVIVKLRLLRLFAALTTGAALGVAGVAIARDSAVIEAGLDLQVTRSTSFGLAYQGQLASAARDHGVRANLAIRF